MAEGRTPYPSEADGWYVEPLVATEFLLDRERLPAMVYDPACGQGNILSACRRRGHRTFGADIVLRGPVGCDAWAKRDFLVDAPFTFDGEPYAVVFNPPYGAGKLLEAFIRRALALDEPSVKVCAFVPDKFLYSGTRANGLFSEHPPARVYPIWPRPSCPPGQFLLEGGKATGGVANFSWMVWLPGRRRRTEVRWSTGYAPGARFPVDDDV
jgi:hypothetical protein